MKKELIKINSMVKLIEYPYKKFKKKLNSATKIKTHTNILETKAWKFKTFSSYLDGEVINGLWRVFRSHFGGERWRWVCVKIQEESKNKKKNGNPVGIFQQTHAHLIIWVEFW